MRYPVKVITPPIDEPVTLAEVKLALRIDSDDLDDEITRLVTASRRALEQRLGRVFLEQTLELALDQFPGGSSIVLPRAVPLQSIESVAYTDSDGVEADMPEADYFADVASEPGRLVLAYGASWPSFTPYPAAAVKIQYICGQPIASPPEPFAENLKQAVLILVRDQLDHPGEGPNGASYEQAMQRAIGQLTSSEQRTWVF